MGRPLWLPCGLGKHGYACGGPMSEEVGCNVGIEVCADSEEVMRFVEILITSSLVQHE